MLGKKINEKNEAQPKKTPGSQRNTTWLPRLPQTWKVWSMLIKKSLPSLKSRKNAY